MPKTRRTWASHAKTGYYLGAAWKHYRCHAVWVKDTRSTRIGQTVFFKHKYITQPEITTADALTIASDNLCNALRNAPSESNAMQTAVNALTKIFKCQAQSSTSETDLARARRKVAQDQRVHAEETAKQAQRVQTESQAQHPQRVETDAAEPAPDSSTLQESDLDPDAMNDDEICMPGLQVTYPSNSEDAGQAHPAVVSQDDWGPSQNTRSARRRQRLLTAVEMSSSCPNARQAAARKYPLQFMVDMAAAVLDDETGELLEYRHLIQRPKYKKDWGHSFGNEIGRLAQGMPGRNTGTNTIYFIHRHDVPQDRWKDVTSGRIVCNVRPQKEEVFRTRLTVDGSRINIDMDCGTPTASLLTVKLLLNSVISTDGAKFMSIDIKDFYLNTPMDRPEFLKMNIKNFPDDIIKHYNLLRQITTRVTKHQAFGNTNGAL